MVEASRPSIDGRGEANVDSTKGANFRILTGMLPKRKHLLTDPIKDGPLTVV